MISQYVFWNIGKLIRSNTTYNKPVLFNSFYKCTSFQRTYIDNVKQVQLLKNNCFCLRTKKNFQGVRRLYTEEQKIKNKSTLHYLTAGTILVGGFTYLSVLLYRIYCQSTGKGGQAVVEELGEKVAKMEKKNERLITVTFNADVNSQMLWNFRPSQPFIKVSPGETALAFYTAKNPSNKPITGIATYNVLPFDAGKHFNKIQCFCFEEQMLNPNEEVDMPVFFYLDPEFVLDPRLETINNIVLSYTFFESKEGLELPRPEYS